MFGLGFPELILILIIALIIFGPGKLPEVGRAIGKSVREFKKATNEIKKEFELDEPPSYTKEEKQASKKEEKEASKVQEPPTPKNPYATIYDEGQEPVKEEEKEV